MRAAIYGAAFVAGALANYRWLRLAQREHYQPGRVSAIGLLWLTRRPANLPLWLAAGVLTGLAVRWPVLALPALAVLAVWPVGLSTRPRTAPVRFTPRLWRLLAVQAALWAAAAVLLGPVGAAGAVLLAAPLCDLSLAVLRPAEDAMAGRFVRQARAKLRRVGPAVVAITGSYGKTSTKQYAAHLVATTRDVVASPASFNNLMGLSRTVNERLAPGTEVFIAEMGTYGPGEIRRLCEIFRPRVAAITTIGEAHLERMGSRETIVRAKSEIVEGAEVAVLSVDVPELAALADRIEGRQRVLRCSTAGHPAADVVVRSTGAVARVCAGGEDLGEVALPPGSHEINVAVAVGIADALGVPHAAVARALKSLPVVDHRATVYRTEAGPTVIDDTYNANPSGAAKAVATARTLVGEGGRVWVVTPGMVELGSVQFERNSALAASVAAVPGSVLAVVGHTNRRALLHGAGAHPGAEVRCFESRQEAVAEVANGTGPGDVVLYENDLPDHYP